MKRLIWRKKVFLCLLVLIVVLVSAALRLLTKGPTDTSRASQYSIEKLKQILDEAKILNRKRIALIEDTCKKYNLGLYRTSNISSGIKYPPTPQYSIFYFDVGNKIAYCPTYKAGSTTWLYNLLALNGIKEDAIKGKQISQVARTTFPEVDGELAENSLSKCMKLLCVRHPFERILSAYRDKLEEKERSPEDGTLHFYKRWGARIRGKYRNSGRPEPTFLEFVRYLIDTDLLLYADDHWIPYNAYCTPCLIRYDYVAEVESLTADQLYFAESMKLKLSPRAKHSSPKLVSAQEYFSQITKLQLRELYSKYELDFKMFNYSIYPYLNYAKD